MKITKTIAENMAKAMTQEAKTKARDLELALANELRDLYLAELPKPVRDLWYAEDGKHRPYVNQCMSVIYRNKRFYPDTAVPQYERNYTTITSIEVGSQKDDEITRMDAEVERLQTEAKRLEIDIYNTLMSLGTDKKVRENFPDAIPYLPTPQMCYLPALPIESISERLKSFSK